MSASLCEANDKRPFPPGGRVNTHIMGPRGQIDLIDFQRLDENCKFLRIDMDQEVQTLTLNFVQ